MKDLEPVFLLPEERREKIRKAAVGGLSSMFPIIGTHREVHLENPGVDSKRFSRNDHKTALLKAGTLAESVKGDLVIKDKTGRVIDKKKNHTLMRLPYYTSDNSFVIDGNEYVFKHQLRTRPGVYTRRRANDEIEASFNLAKGANFRLSLDPSKGHVQIEQGSSKIPLYPVLRSLGATHKDISNYWGRDLADRNLDAFDSKRDRHVKSLYDKVIRPNAQTAVDTSGRASQLAGYFQNTVLDKDTTQKTLGKGFTSVTPESMLLASKKLLGVYKGEQDPDDRDSLEFQRLVSVEDLMKFRMDLKGREAARKIKSKLDMIPNPSVDRVLPSSSLTPLVKSYVTTSRLATLPTQINPVESLDASTSITRVGEGGIENDRAIPKDVRSVHPTHLGIIDPFRTPESHMAGVDVRAALFAHRDPDGQLYTPVKNVRKKGKLEMIAAKDILNSVVAFPNQSTQTGRVDALNKGRVAKVRPKDVDYAIHHPNVLAGIASSLVPFADSTQGNRMLMGAKMVGQALPLKEREQPLVQVSSHGNRGSNEAMVAERFLPRSEVDGEVSKVDKDFIYIKGKDRKVMVPYSSYFPLASKTYIHDTPVVKKGDKVKKGQRLVDNNFTQDGTLALGKNLEVAYTAYHGLNTNDAVVISQSAAEKMKSLSMSKKTLSVGKETLVDHKRHAANFPRSFNKDQYSSLTDGVVTPGTVLKKGDPIVAAVRRAPPSVENQILGRIHKSLRRPYTDASIVWDKDVTGEVVDVVRTGNRVAVTVKAEEPLKLGDKLTNRYGGKGVVSKIVPDADMLQNEKGDPVDLLWASTGVVSRINPSQILETSLAKVARKEGKPIAVPNYQKVNNVKWVREKMKKAGVKDKETLTDPITGKKIPGVMTGPQYMYKLFKSTDTNYSARGVGAGYDLNNQPAKGGESGSKGTGGMVINALLAHNARDTLKENATVKGTKNTEYWRAVQLGLPVPQPQQSFAYDKFTAMLSGAGLRLGRSGNDVSLSPMTDSEVEKMSSGEIKNGRMVRAKDLRSEPGGLFDTGITGGLTGTKWSHVRLPEPVLNPVFSDPARRLLGLTERQLKQKLKESGGASIKKELNSLDTSKEIARLEKEVWSKKGAAQDDITKRIKALRALDKVGMKAGDAYTMQNLPVMPPVYRPITPSFKGDLLVADINHLYKDALLASEKLKEAKSLGLPEEDVSSIRSHLHDTVNAVVGTAPPASRKLAAKQVKGIVNTIAGTKDGFYNSKLVARRLDLTGRGTAAPDPSLGMDEVGLPEDMAWTMYQPFITQRLVKRGYPAVQARQLVSDRAPQAREELAVETRTRPVTLNRAPTLHKYNLISAYPRIIPGKTIKVSPFIENGMNLDYDGDALQVHLPASQGAVKDAENMLLSKNMFSEQTPGRVLAMPKHEAVAGLERGLTVKSSGRALKVFNSRAEALAAYRRGEVDLSDPVEIKNA